MLILIEFNELCPSLLKKFMAEGAIPNFKRLHDASAVYTTDAAEDPPQLEPWIQWPTIHNGRLYADHGIYHLGDGRKSPHKGVAEVLSDAGVPVGVFGSMNMNYGKLKGYVVPDPWDTEGTPHPGSIAPFYKFVAGQVQESSRDGGGSKLDAAKFGMFLLGNGVSPATIKALAAQLLAERRDPGVKWRRASLLDMIQYDVFKHLNKKHKVRFATFFCNSTAHFQHYFWRNMEPEKFSLAPPETDHASLSDAIRDGYLAMDALVGRFLADYPDATLVLCTALSQQPWTDTTKCTFRPHSFEGLLEFAGVSPKGVTIKPVMAEEFHAEFPSEAAAEEAERKLLDLEVDGEPLMKVERTGRAVFGGCRVIEAEALGSTVTKPDGTAKPFQDLLYMVHSMRSGRHHPDGVLWVRDPKGTPRVVEGKVPLTAIAPTILASFGVAQPASMPGRPLEAVEAEAAVAS